VLHVAAPLVVQEALAVLESMGYPRADALRALYATLNQVRSQSVVSLYLHAHGTSYPNIDMFAYPNIEMFCMWAYMQVRSVSHKMPWCLVSQVEYAVDWLSQNKALEPIPVRAVPRQSRNISREARGLAPS